MTTKQLTSKYHPNIHIVLLGREFDVSIMSTLLKRRIDELFFAVNAAHSDIARDFTIDLKRIGIKSTIIRFSSCTFETMLSEILTAINCEEYNQCQPSFDITYANPLMSVVACVASNIIGGNIICDQNKDGQRITELHLATLTNLTARKKELLGFLAHQKKPFPQSELTTELEIPRSGVSRKLQELEEANYIERFTSCRKKYVSITPLGKSVFHTKEIRKRRVWSSDPHYESQSFLTHLELKDNRSHQVTQSI